MPRPKAVIPKSLLKAWIPLELRARVDLKLVSEVEGRVPQGAYSTYVAELIRSDIEFATLNLAAYGFGAGYFVRGPKAMIEALRQRLEV